MRSMYNKIVKRCFDFVIALLMLIVVSPILLVLSIAVRINLGRPILFKQERSGRGMKSFKIMKFRTMSDKRNMNGNLLPDHLRVTRLGVFLRSSSLDELPELINILIGDMSFIGPRPLPTTYNPYYTESEKARFNVRGGLVPPDSVDPNPIISWDKQLEYESEYGNSVSFVKDLKIIVGVFRILLKRGAEDYGSFERKALNEERKDMSV